MANIHLLRAMTRGAYDLQSLRIQAGLRLCANFRAKFSAIAAPAEPEDAGADAAADEITAEIGESKREEAKVMQGVLAMLRKEYKLLTAGIARNRTLPSELGFVGAELISEHPELTLVHQYMMLENAEKQAFTQLTKVLEGFPIWNEYLAKQKGIGPAMGAVLLSYIDPNKAHNVSQVWAYCGLSTGPDGKGISRRREHLVERQYTAKNGELKTRVGTVFEPWLQARLIAVLGPSFMRSASPWRKTYDDYKHRISTDPNRLKITVVEARKRIAAGEAVVDYWPPARIHRAANRYMLKMFLLEFWMAWRELEGLPVTASYEETRRGRLHGAA